MKRFLYSILISWVVILTLSSCMEDSDKTYSDYCYISAFSLGTITQAHHITGSEGQDSIYYTSLSGSAIPVQINQRTLQIENTDSLPYGALIDKILVSCSFEGLLVHRRQDLSGMDPADTVWVTFSESDSIDFTKPRSFVVVASDGNSMRNYTVKLNVHQMDPDETVWENLGEATIPCPADATVRKLSVVDGQLVVLAQMEDGTVICYTRSAKTQGEWIQQTLSGNTDLEVETLVEADGQLYASTKGGKVVYSVDGFTWNTRLMGQSDLRLIGVSPSCFYALVGQKLMSTPKNEESWSEEQLDDEANLLPEKDIVMLNAIQPNTNNRLLIAGKQADGKVARLWSKTWGNNGVSEKEAIWAYYPENEANKSPFPLLKQSNVLPYDGGIMLFGGMPEAVNDYATNITDEAMGCVYFSKDYGITWIKHSIMEFSDALKESAANASYITASVEDGCTIWVLLDGQLWRGRLNSVLFENAKK